ncbi:MAG: GNAT family N-acetyltransferase [Dehalococcoidia bacterium]|nr:GNAT family N-acetyltransferase [Dehalococcoidia bacterium]
MKLIQGIETPRLVIRPFTSQDEAAFVDFMQSEDAVRYLMFTDEQKTADGARMLLQAVIDSYAGNHPIHSYAITLRDGPWIGSCGVSEVSAGGIWECYYSLLPRFWKHGYATEATTLLIRHCFQRSSVSEIRAYMSPDNPHSPGVARRAGMTDMGIGPYPVWAVHGRMFRMTREEHEKMREQEDVEIQDD